MALFDKINQNMSLSENPIAEDPIYENARISSYNYLLRRLSPVFYPGNNVSNILAIHGTGRFISSDAPRSFWSNYGRSGANVQRGYEVGKYMDRNLVSMEAEYRKETQWLNHKLGFIGAVGMGKVFGNSNDANNLSNKFKNAPWLPTLAIGARYRIMAYERLNLKVDYAVGKWWRYLFWYNRGFLKPRK